MTVYDLIYQTTGQIKETGHIDAPLVCSNCREPVNADDIKCPYCRRFFMSQDEIDDMIDELVRRVADVIIKNVRGE